MHQNFIQNLLNLSSPGEQFLLAVSGGIDSMVMCDLFLHSNENFAIAHCNFSLRGKESDGDEKLVRDFAEKHKIPFFSKRFNTQTYAEKNKIGIQEAARNLRYNWFEELTQEADYQLIATAHHLNDSIETLVLNLTKGTGLKGLKGIPAKRNNIIRPLLNFSKEEINNYAEKHKIEYREDSSNSSLKYQRNLIRNQVIPLLKKINPALEKSMAENFARMGATDEIFSFFIKKTKQEILSYEGGIIKISKRKLALLPSPVTILFEILKPYNFNYSNCENLWKIMDAQSGKKFHSDTHQVLIDREYFLLKPIIKKENFSYLLHKNDSVKIPRIEALIKAEVLNHVPNSFSTNNRIAHFDLNKLKFPLTIESPKKGDKFCPLGMKGKHQKLQDFFSNLKLNLFEKEDILVIRSGNEICWVVGHRISENFKIDANTEAAIKLEIS